MVGYAGWTTVAALGGFHLVDLIITELKSHMEGFQLLDLIILELKSHVIPYKFKCSHWWKIHL